ncbi:UDP-glucose 4-epimerase GalE [Paenalcaligenes hominis]|uniref:UDP-glucose 4-epimerase GalE n=1 Tax=Paenalcaligenes hominis TaxID=643674 RepID=UPI003526C361
MRLLVTGGLGFIGSHTTVLLLQAGYEVVILDNLSNSHLQVLNAIEQLCHQRPQFIQGDVRDRDQLNALFTAFPCQAVLHFAGLKAVGESVQHPLRYYDNNVNGLISLLLAMEQAHVHQLVFSSSATVYGEPTILPLTESHPLSATNPYGQTKLIGEHLLQDWHRSQRHSAIACLRYFNPVSAHPSGLLGENPQGKPNNLMPYIMQVASGQRDTLHIFGNDYPTPDGTGIRDYLHVMDLAAGHVAAVDYLLRHPYAFLQVNLGTGQGYSVLELMHMVERVTGKPIPHEIVARRPGDIASCYADPTLAKQYLNWVAHHDLFTMCADAWRWTQHHQP